MTITISGIETKDATQKHVRFTALIWGSSGTGKTVLAATAPGRKLWLLYDPEGDSSIAYRDDVEILNLADQPDNFVEKFKSEDPLGLDKILAEHPEIETVVFDSLTTYGEHAMAHAVVKARGTPKGKSSTLEDPGFAGYGNKNTWTRLLVKNLLTVTAKHKRNMIFIAHEDKPTTNDQGQVLFISIMLGSSLNEQVPVSISEIWNVSDTGKERRIAIRPCRMRKPMRTRMFTVQQGPEFKWTYNAEKPDDDPGNVGMRISDWYAAWQDNDYGKIDLPS